MKNPQISFMVVNASHDSNPEHESDYDLDVMTAEPELQKPPQYAVIMYNDDYTPMDFVVEMLMVEFKHSEDSAVQIMLNIHNHGQGVAGVYPKEIAETKAYTVNRQARLEGFPLMTEIEPYTD